VSTALACLRAVAESYGISFDPEQAGERHGLAGAEPDAAALARIAAEAGFEASPAEPGWDGLAGLTGYPCLARLENGNTVALIGFTPGDDGGRVLVADPLARAAGPFELDRAAMEKSWNGHVTLLRPRAAHANLECLVLIARHHGVDASLQGLVHQHALDETEADPETLARIARELGFTARRARLGVEDLYKLGEAFPALLTLQDGRSVILASVREGEDGQPPDALVVDPRVRPLRRDSWTLERLAGSWDGEIMLLKRSWRLSDEEQPFGLRWFVPEIMRQGRAFLDVGLASLMLLILALALPIYFQVVIDKILVHGSFSTLQVLSFGMLAVLAFDAGFNFLRGYLLNFATSRIDIRIATRTFARLLSLPMHYFGRSHAGVIIQHMQQADKIREFLTGRLFFTLLDAAALVVFLPALFLYSPALTAVVVFFSLALAAFLAVLIPFFKRRLLSLYKAEGERQSFLVETIRGMETVKSLSLEPVQRRKWDEKAARAVDMRLGVGGISVSATAGMGFLEKLMSLAIPWIGVYLVFERQMSVGALIAFQMLASRVSQPLLQIVSLIHEYQEKALAVRMLASIMNEAPERPASAGGMRPPVRGEVSFERVTFRYAPGAPPALSDVSLTFAAGSFVGIVGRSGSGKSTLGRLIQGLYAVESGVVRLDGHDVREFDLAHLRRHIGVVLQENFLFRGTVRENIGVSRPSATLSEIAWAAKLAGADEFIARLPKGFDTPLEENASNLSGGQRQRLAIARALLSHPKALIFDEATSALDAESEEIIQNNLAAMARGRTTIMISHRLSMLAGADLIVVMEQGRVADSGTHQELLARCETYASLWRSQNRHVLGQARGLERIADA
jgi:ATP-binding cassette subfamily B protein